MKENLTGRWVKRIAYSTYDECGVKIGEYDQIERYHKVSDYWLKKFLSCPHDLLFKNFELMPIGFNPNNKQINNYYFY